MNGKPEVSRVDTHLQPVPELRAARLRASQSCWEALERVRDARRSLLEAGFGVDHPDCHRLDAEARTLAELADWLLG